MNNLRKVYKVTSENEFNSCIKYLNKLNIKQCGKVVSYNELLKMYHIPDNIIYIIIRDKDKEFYFRDTKDLDNRECPNMGKPIIKVEYNISNFNVDIRKEKLKKIKNYF